MRIVTLNLAGLKNDWIERREEAVISGLKAIAPDVVCFQEATFCRNGMRYDQAATIGAAIGLQNHAFIPYGNPVEVMSPHVGGLALIARWPMTAVRDQHLPPGQGSPSDARVGLIVSLKAPGGDVVVATTHLSWKADEKETRLMQLGLMLKEFESGDLHRANARAVLTGDMNATEDEDCIQLANQVLKDAYRSLHPSAPGYTWVKANPYTDGWKMPDRRLDYIFCPRDCQILRCEVVLAEPNPVYASDHFGVLAELAWT